jgi:serpin B
MSRCMGVVAAAVLTLVIVGKFLFSPWSDRSVADPPTAPAPKVAAVSDAVAVNNRFAFDLYAHVRQADAGNLAFSPASLTPALMMVSAGARGETCDEIAKVLRLPYTEAQMRPAFHDFLGRLTAPGQKAEQPLSMANRLWGQAGLPFEPDFIRVAETAYRSGLQTVKFQSDPAAARREVNAWVTEQTRGKVTDLLSPEAVNTETRLILTNAIYLKAEWESPFPSDHTRDATFHLDKDRPVSVPMMVQRATFPLAVGDDADVLELPYKSGDLAMLVVLPKGDGLAALEQSLSAEKLDGWRKALEPRDVMVALPRFRCETKLDLADTLSAMGMRLAFTTHADFSGICSADSLHVSNVAHQTVLAVNEAGTEATAATGVVVASRSMPAVFRADHPFLFALIHKPTGSILFLGRVVDPRGPAR